jgi:hypothetical protein
MYKIMRPLKKQFIIFAVIFTGTFASLNAQVKITDGAVLTLNPNSLLELESTTRGLLIPRMPINSLILPHRYRGGGPSYRPGTCGDAGIQHWWINP